MRHFTHGLVVMLAPALASCGAVQAAGEALGKDYTKREAGQCHDTGGQSRPLVVDWDSADRGALEARASRGLVVVRYEGCRMEVLQRCTVKGAPSYDYIGLTPKRDTVVMRDANEVHANIPVYAAKFEGKLAQSGSLNVGMTIVGQWDAARAVPRLDELQGECGGATHVVTALTVGSFEFFAANAVAGRVGAEGFGASAGAQHDTQHEVLNKDGEDAQCRNASGADTKPPFGCGALVRVEVVPLGAARKDEPACGPGTQWDGAQCIAAKEGTTCDKNQLADKEGRCVAKREDVTVIASHGSRTLVAPVAADCSDVRSCEARCDAGDAKGCLGLGGYLRASLMVGHASDDGRRAEKVLGKACDGAEATACTALGEMKYQGLGIAKDASAAKPLLERACEKGDPAGCNDVGLVLVQGSPSDPAGAAVYFRRACDARSSLGCLGLGLLHRSGRGVTKDPVKARELLKKACDANITPACKQL